VDFFGKIGIFAKLTRAEHAVLSAAGVFVALIIALKAGGEISFDDFAFALFVPVLINLGAFALNDYLDIEADRANGRKERPLVSGELEPVHALNTGIFGLVVGGALGFLINFEAGIISSIFAFLSFLYNWKLKDIAVLGNLLISFSMGISFIFAAVATGFLFGNIPIELLILAIGAGFAGFGREIVKTVQDVEGDRKARGSKTLPVLIGKKNSLIIAALSFVAFAKCVLWLVVYSKILSLNILSVGMLALCSLAYFSFAYMCAFTKMDERSIERIRKASLEVLAVAMVAILICAI